MCPARWSSGFKLAAVAVLFFFCGAGIGKSAADEAAPTFAAQYACDRLTIHLTASGSNDFTGKIDFKGQSFPFHATASGDHLQGSFESDGSSFPFTASLEGSTLVFITGGKTYRLQSSDAPPPSFVDFTVHDTDPNLLCDAVHLRVPAGWWARGRVSWGLTALSPARALIETGSAAGPEMWVGYPVQTFVWRDNFNLFGLQFPLKLGDADPVTGEEIEQPLGSAADCITRVILPRYRKDLVGANVVSSRELSPGECQRLKDSLTHDDGQPPAPDPHIATVRKGAVIRFEYARGNRTLQEDVLCLVLYADMPANNLGVMHLWQIEFASSFRAEKGRLDEQTRTIADVIRDSIRPDPQWVSKSAVVQKQIVDAFGRRLVALAQAQEANIRRQANDAIFQITQRSYHRRMELEGQQFHQMDNAINGLADYKTPDGKTIQAPIAPMGQSAWLGSDGKTHNFGNGINPNEQAGVTQTFERLDAQ